VELRVVAFPQSAKKSAKTIVTLWILSTKILFLVGQPGGYHFIEVCQGCFNCIQLQIRTSCPSASQLFFFEILWANSVHNKTFAVGFEKSKASDVEVVSCFASVNATAQERQSHAHIMSN